ncbi:MULTISPECIES: sporulation integral membrane protein YtvI [unclassified Clostridium]|uniref:sporulation integral membrane protein YtvI n=1 Tax=unclassified Clostridium TaxID=2614128 RepID=UPI00052C724D|nr:MULTISPECIES: sporulation integral membrane protein YtvI [unclassified Clostridium]KGK86792.1 sporulation protein [Clostridium sp. HMP27]
MGRFLQRFDRTILFFIIYTLVFITFFKTLQFTLPFVLALIFALILRKPSRFICKKFKIKNSISSLLATLFFFTVILSLLYTVIFTLTKEAIQLAKNIQLYLNTNSNNINYLVQDLEQYYNNLDPSIINAIEKNLSSYISKISNLTVLITGKIIQGAISFLGYIPSVFMVVLFTLISTYFFTRDLSSAKTKFLHALENENSDRLIHIIHEAKRMLTNYAMSYLLVICITFIETLIGFTVLKVKYSGILSVVAAIFDILPVLGVGGIYIPLALIYFFIVKNYFTAFGILIWYIVVTVVRQIVEPKIVSASLGLHPVSVIAAIFIGLKVNGISGMFFCIFLVVFYKVLKSVDVL